MQKIPFDLACPGMRLGQRILAHDGSLVASQGDTVDESLLKKLDMMGFTHLIVQGKDVPSYDMGYDVEQCLCRIDFLFRKHQENAFMVKLKNFLLKHFEERL